MAAIDPSLTADRNPFLRVIKLEAHRLPGGVLISAGHVAAVLDAPIGSTALVDRLAAWCDHDGLDARPEEPDGIRFTHRSGADREELTPAVIPRSSAAPRRRTTPVNAPEE